MRWRVLLTVSLAANLLLALSWMWSSRQSSLRLTRAAILAGQTNAPLVKTAVVVRRQFFSWSELESDDYPTYIKNLREINCPEQTIRDIIIADVNALYARRRALEVVTPEQQWWRVEPDTNILQVANAKLRELDDERRDLLATLLGADWESGDLVSLPRPTRVPIPLDGPLLGTLPTEVKQVVEDINARAQDRIEDYLEAERKAGREPDMIQVEKVRQEARQELAKVLTPEQLEEFLLRYSQTANGLREDLAQMQHFNATQDEFRALFRALDPINQQIALLDESTLQGAQNRDVLLAQAEAALKLALGDKRYEQYRLLHDEAYRDAYARAADEGAPEKAGDLFEISQVTSKEIERIRDDPTLTEQQRAIEIKRIELEQLKATTQALGHELPPEPPKPPKPVPAKTHVVAAGEGLNRLAQIYGVQPGDLRKANPDVNFDRLKAGDKINVPLSLLVPPELRPQDN